MNYKELEIWKELKGLVKLIYKITESFPLSEQFELTNQIRSCALSAQSNIAEEIARNQLKNTLQFLYISHG